MNRIVIAACIALTAFTSTKAARADAPKNKWVAAGLNWVAPGAGYIYNGKKPLYVTLPMLAGAIGLTYVEQIHEFEDGKRLIDHDKTAFGVVFGAVFLLNTALAIDAYREADAINQSYEVRPTAWRLDLRPVRTRDTATGYALVVGRAF